MRSQLPRLAVAVCSLMIAHVHVAAGNTTHIKRAASCGGNRFQCKDGSCIDSDSVCNRDRDCPDGSDESPDACLSALLPAVSTYIEREVLLGSARCPPGSHQCPTGQCIGPHLVCDGRSDCPAGADERLPQCRGAPPLCNPGEFRCTSGLCIPPSSVCNGVRDCSDGGDEDPGLCGSRTNVGRRCSYPLYPEHGSYIVLDCESCSPIPGTPLQAGASILQYNCSSRYELQGANVITCHNGKWSSDPPACEPRCPSLTTEAVSADCFLRGSRFTCDRPVPPGTRAEVGCQQYYAWVGARRQSLVCQDDGRWSGPSMECYPACGKDRSDIATLISGGMVVKGPEFPWHVAIYNNEVYNCGGSLISLKYVLSAAHCFWSEGKHGTHPTEVFKVIAGKLYRSYTVNEPGQQERAVQRIDIPETYLGSEQSFRDDIAVLTVASPFKLSARVGPVCVDWDGSKNVSPGDMGHIAGWGATEAGKSSEVLLSAELPVIDHRECLNNIEAKYRMSFGRDKICAGFRNGTTVCRGDSGGGLTFVHDISPLGASTELHFVQGVVSLGIPSYDDCNLRNYVAFTNVSIFLSFLHKYKDVTFVL